MQRRLREYTTATLENALTAAQAPFLVHFGTDWCPPCKRLERVLLELLNEGENNVLMGKVNVEDQPDLARAYSVTRNPTVCVFRQGQVVARREGFAGKLELLELLNS